MTRYDLPTNQGGQISLTQFKFTYKDLQQIAGAGAQTVTLLANPGKDTTPFVIPVNGNIIMSWIRVNTQFSGGALSALTMSLGDAAVTAGVMAAQDILSTANKFNLQRGMATEITDNTTVKNLTATFTPTGAAVAAATAGDVDIFYVWLNTLPA